MKNYKVWLGIVLTLLLVNSVVLAIIWFHKRPGPMGMRDNRMQQPMEPKDLLSITLAFTPKQEEQFTAMRTNHHELTNKLNEENHKLRDSLFENIKKDKIDSAAIDAITKKISDNQVQIEKVTLYHFRGLRAILTPAQQTKFDGIINEVLQMVARPGGMQPPPKDGDKPHKGGITDGGRPEHGRPDMLPEREKMRMHPGSPEGRPPDSLRRREHFGPPPDGMPPPGGRRKGHRPPPPDGPPDGPPPAK